MITIWQTKLPQITVLVVDDSRISRFLIQHLIKQLCPHARIIEAVDAKSALACATQHVIDCAVIDYNMPGSNGLDLALKLAQYYTDIKLAIISADSHIPLQAKHHHLKITQLTKPIQPLSLLQFLQK